MGTILFFISLGVEIFFCLWAFASRKRHQKAKELIRILGFILLVLWIVLGVLQGFLRYGALILALGFQVLLGGIRLIQHKEKPLRRGIMVLSTVGTMFLYFICLIPAFLFPQYSEPAVTGPHQVEIEEFTWEDKSRPEIYTDLGKYRELTIKVFYPKESGTYPLVLFSHGSLGVIDSNLSTCKELASNGYVVVSIGHTYQAVFVKNVKGKTFFMNADFMNSVMEENGTGDSKGEELVYHNSRIWMDVRCRDISFILDTILNKVTEGEDGPFSRVNAEKIGLFGHSLGGAACVQVGRERKDIDAVIDLEGTMFGEYIDFQNGTEVFNENPYTVPILDVNSGDIDRQARELPGQGYVNFYMGKRAIDYHYLVVEGASHSNFTDLPMVSPFLAGLMGSGDIDAKECIEGMNQTILTFFNTYLK